jgi:hypothetical protein
MIIKLILNLQFWALFCGFVGSILIFFFGLPPKFNPDGHSFLLLQSSDKENIKKGKIYKKLGYLGVSLLAVSFLIQIIPLLTNA